MRCRASNWLVRSSSSSGRGGGGEELLKELRLHLPHPQEVLGSITSQQGEGLGGQGLDPLLNEGLDEVESSLAVQGRERELNPLRFLTHCTLTWQYKD